MWQRWHLVDLLTVMLLPACAISSSLKVARHMSHVTRHTSHVTRHLIANIFLALARLSVRDRVS